MTKKYYLRHTFYRSFNYVRTYIFPTHFLGPRCYAKNVGPVKLQFGRHRVGRLVVVVVVVGVGW